MQFFYTRIVPLGVFVLVAWIGTDALNRLIAKAERLCPRINPECLSITNEQQLLSLCVFLAAAALAWASVRFNTAVER